MKNRILILLVVAATLFACNSDSMNTEDGIILSKRSKDKTISFKIMNLEGNYEFTGSALCPSILSANGQGTVPHLGLSMLSEEWCNNGDPNDLGTRTIIITAANGDELHGYHSSIDFDIQTGFFTETLVIDGGTGRFTNACGTFVENVQVSFPPENGKGTFTLNIVEGTLSFTEDCDGRRDNF